MRLAILSIVIALGLGLAVMPNALASHGNDTASCEGYRLSMLGII